MAGGGTDLPEFYQWSQTRVLAVAIDREVVVSVASDPDAARAAVPPRPGWYRVEHAADSADLYVGAATACLATTEAVHVVVTSPVAPGSGLGGSGAYLVALVDALARRVGRVLPKPEIAEIAFTIERDRLGRTVGKQDCWVSAIGGAVRLDINTEGHVIHHTRDDLLRAATRLLKDSRLILFGLPETRDAATVLASSGLVNSAVVDTALRLANENERAFLGEDINQIGAVLRRHWDEKVRRNPAADHPVCRRLTACADSMGVLGFKVVGAGGGGHLLVAAVPGRAQEIRALMATWGLRHIRVRPVATGLRRSFR
ncbi:hypothetical protein [Brachybacterium sp. GPGPB12]|uniref:GHMP family kinase ATP-binding protein n=1 Tax=Brachybacterium sp. GPGPB12 TaxID=3023517 RepID=UPI00313456C1